MAADNKATVTLSLVDLTQDRIKTLRTDIEALAKMRASSASNSAERDQARALAAQGAALKDAERGWRNVDQAAGRAKATIGSMSGGGVGAARGFVGAAAGNAGLGALGSILTIGSIGAAVAAAGAIAGQSIRMAYEFEKSSTRAAQALGMATGGSNLQSNISAIQNAAKAGLQYNFARPEMAQAIAAYGAASGAGVRGATQAAGGIAMYSRAYGMDPTLVAGLMGRASGLDNRGFDQEAGGMFGAAEHAGSFGKRTEEFITTATSTLAQMQAANARGNYGGADAANLLANVARGQSGYYQTAAGSQAFFGAGKGLIGGMAGSPGGMAFGISAGISPLDVMLNRGGPVNENKAMQRIMQIAQGGRQESLVVGAMMQQGIGTDTIRETLDRLPYKNGILQGRASASQDLNALYATSGATTPKTEAQLAKAAADAYKNTELGHYETLFTNIQEHELQLGQTILKKLEGSASAINEILNGQYLKGINDLIGSNKGLVAALIAAALVQAGGAAGLLRILGPMARLIPGLGAVGGVGAVGVGALAVGAVLATTSAVGSDEASKYDNRGQKYWLDYIKKHGGRLDAVPGNVLADLRGDVGDNQLLEAISGPEAGTPKNGIYPDSPAGALGRYQIMPGTAAPLLHDVLAHISGQRDSPMYYDSQNNTLSAAGRQLVRTSPQIQHALSIAYIRQLEDVATKAGFTPQSMHGQIPYDRMIAGMYYAGPAHMNQPDWVAGQDQPGNTNHLTESQYEDSMMRQMGKGNHRLELRADDGTVIFLGVTAHAKNKGHANTQSRAKSRSSAR